MRMSKLRDYARWLIITIVILLLGLFVPFVYAADFLSRRTAMQRLLIVLVVLLAVTLVYTYHIVHRELGDPQQTYGVLVKPGDSAGDVARKLVEEGYPLNKRLYSVLMRLYGTDRAIKPGRYEIKGGVSHYDLVQWFKEGRRELVRLTIREGLTLKEIVPLLSRTIPADSAELEELLADQEFLSSFEIEAPGFEGYLYPETYTFYPYQDCEEVIAELVETFKSIWTPEMMARTDSLGMSLNEVVTLASMIEAETADGSERELISSVFHNRLRKGWKLQCDPTVIYAMGGLDRPILRKDLAFESSYNTYLHEGLPPGPIGSPGLAAIRAALYPAATDYFYFVATGNGKHIFSSTLAEHNKAISNVKRQQRLSKQNQQKVR